MKKPALPSSLNAITQSQFQFALIVACSLAAPRIVLSQGYFQDFSAIFGPGTPTLIGGSPYATSNQTGRASELIQQGGEESTEGYFRIARESPDTANVMAFDWDNSSSTENKTTASFDFRALDSDGIRSQGGFAVLLLPTNEYGETGANFGDFGPYEDPNLQGALGIGFDTFNNDIEPQDEPEGMAPVGNHVSVHFDGEKLSQENFERAEFDLVTDDPGVWHRSEISIDGDDFTLTLIDGVDGTRHTLTVTVDLLSTTGNFRPAFAARTGGAADNYDIDNFFMRSIDPCDFDGDGSLGEGDVNILSAAIANGDQDPKFDVNSDGAVDVSDLNFFIGDETKLHTWIGDVNLDGELSTGDLIQMFENGKYETGDPALWSDGDVNGDGVFDSGDLVAALADGGFELGPKWVPSNAVPEPVGRLLPVVVLTTIAIRRRTSRHAE
ncbi:MAG: hypothetical protein KDB27_13485 [Planctomycetales bacterium]|nr:hypothetical protein [Planctomycetales bacterium]